MVGFFDLVVMKQKPVHFRDMKRRCGSVNFFEKSADLRLGIAGPFRSIENDLLQSTDAWGSVLKKLRVFGIFRKRFCRFSVQHGKV